MTVVDLRRLGLRPGEERSEQHEVTIAPLDLAGQRYAVVPEQIPAELTVTRAANGIVLQLRFTAELHGPCYRCLEDATLVQPIDAREYQAEETKGDEELESVYVEDDRLELSAWSRDSVVLALPVVVLSIWLAVDFDQTRMAIMAALEAVFYFYAAGSLIAYMLEDEFASADELFAAGATFTLLAWAFAYVHLVCQAVQPGSYGALVNSSDPRTWMELLFLSFTTLSGVGLGDIVPLLPMARALIMIEEFSGVMYLALVVSRLIALAVTTRTAR